MKGRYEASRKRRSNRSKSLALVLSLVLVIGCVAGGTLAWLKARTTSVQNTFSTSDISIELDEGKVNEDGLTVDEENRVKTTQNFKMIPGWTIEKDPVVTVNAGSEACYLFVQITEANNSNPKYIEWTIANGWTALDATKYPGVYYREVEAIDVEDADAEFAVLKDNKVTVPDTITEANMTAAETNIPSLTFTAYAVQLYSTNDTKMNVTTAWDQAQTLT